VLIQAHQNLQEAEKKNLNPIEIKNITDDHTWELTKTIALGLDVDDLEEQATEIQNKIARKLLFMAFKITIIFILI
jgi:polyhydroxyalkanoate synthesis regulator phasin